MVLLGAPLCLFTLFTTAVAQILTASLPGSKLDGLTVEASGQAFYIGGNGPATYCPTQVEPYCPNVTGTFFAGLGALYVEVPGGQQVYIRENGAMAFTQAHSAYVPPGSYYGGFVSVTIVSACAAPITVLTWKAPDESTEGAFACPVPPPSVVLEYQIFVKTPAFNRTDCVRLFGLLPHALPAGSSFGAWQYT